MPNIMQMTMADLMDLSPEKISRKLSAEEVVHIATELGVFWAYDYQALNQGKPGLHAELKSLRHSDGFFVSWIMLRHANILEIMAHQLAIRFRELGFSDPDLAGGIPDGATALGVRLANILGADVLEMEKENGKIVLVTPIRPQERILLCEDFCTRGTGFREAILDIASKHPDVKFIPCELVIINRGGLDFVNVEGVGKFNVLPIADHRVNDWEASDCPLCEKGSKPIKPKATDENWKLITESQK